MIETELIAAVKQGNQNAFRKLVESYQEMVYRVAYGFLHSAEEADDLSQEVFIEIYESIGKFRQEAGLRTWIYRITVNKSLNQLQKNKRKQIIRRVENFFSGEAAGNPLWKATDGITPVQLLEQKEQEALIRKAINSLPENQKVAFTLHKYDDLSYKEIAEVMELSVSAIESLIHRARLKLRQKLLSLRKKSP